MQHQREVFSVLALHAILLVMTAAKRYLYAWSAGMEPGKAPKYHHCLPRDGVRNIC